ncbi:MAG: metalloregulator ArsR/SmtB family transcription factor [Pseudomonadota bacterium]
MDESQAIAAFAALAEPTRLRILRFLVIEGPAGASAGEIGAAVGAASSRASFHLSALSGAGLIVAMRQSRRMVYRVEFDAVGKLVAYLVEDCCRGDARLRACCGGS